MKEIQNLYNIPLSSNRTGALYNAFPYPTKISPEAIAIFIACHTEIGATILDPFAGSGTTGLATKICDNPTPYMIETAKKLGLKPKWGKRKAVLYELSVLGSFVSNTMNNPPSAIGFKKNADKIIKEVEAELGYLYNTLDPYGNDGALRYAIWSDILLCPSCNNESTFWKVAVKKKPFSISPNFTCPKCKYEDSINNIERATENSLDKILQKKHVSKKRSLVKIYGRTGKKTWSRIATPEDLQKLNKSLLNIPASSVPNSKFNWGVLYRKGYHKGITHLHHFYTKRNLIIFSKLWEKIEKCPGEYKDSLKLLLLSYNASHSTLMSRVVIKKNTTDFVITGAQSGVLYISNLPVEKNILDGVKRKVTTLKQAFELVENSKSQVKVYNSSSTELNIPKNTIDYVFTDPPFGDYIPYSEINQINEAWLGSLTNKDEEAIISVSQNKGISEYTNLMSSVFSEINRVLKIEGKMSLVFHSAKAEIWKALIDSYQSAGFFVLSSSILDKIQGSFKQVTSAIKVQGDPILLLSKSKEEQKKKLHSRNTDAVIIKRVINHAYNISVNKDERKPERLFSRYVNACIESGIPVSLGAREFYSIIEKEVLKFQLTV